MVSCTSSEGVKRRSAQSRSTRKRRTIVTSIMRELRGVGECISTSGLIGRYIGLPVVIKRRRKREVAML